jgi:copper homeostasis protein
LNFELEICCFNFQSAVIAEQAGATRIELCANPADGGTTPGYGMIKLVKEKIKIDVYPIIRPRGGDFLYDADDIAMMQTEILLCKELGCEGVVIGLLKQDGTIDKERCKKLVKLAYPMGVSFHRAFDRAIDPFEALEDIVEIGCERILTSGQRPTAIESVQLLNELVRQADDRIIVMPGSGIRGSNIAELAEKTGANEFHSSARINTGSSMEYINANMGESLTSVIADKTEIALMKSNLENYFSGLQQAD